jgi:hypothetical protein
MPTMILVAACTLGAIDVEKAAVYFDEARVLAERDAGRLWGVELAGPMMFADPVTREVVANMADAEGRLESRGAGVFTGVLPTTVGIANAATEWAGLRWTMVMWPLPKSTSSRGVLMMHESFHRIQPNLGHETRNTDNGHLATRDGRLWLRLELRALERALDSVAPDRMQAMRDALAFRAERRSRFPAAADAERGLEFNEGLAEYTGVRLGAGDVAAQRDHARERLRAADRHLAFMRSFAYATGPAYGLLLDELHPTWRDEICPSIGLDTLLAVTLATPYGFDDVAADEDRREADRLAWVAEQTGRYLESPVLKLPVRDAGFSFDPNRVRPLGEHGRVYGTLEVRDVWGRLVAEGGAFWGNDGTIVVTAPTDPGGSAGEGWTLELADGWHIVPDGDDFHVVER